VCIKAVFKGMAGGQGWRWRRYGFFEEGFQDGLGGF